MPTIVADKPLVSGAAVEKHAMHNADIPLRHVPPDSFLLLGYDPLLDGQSSRISAASPSEWSPFTAVADLTRRGSSTPVDWSSMPPVETSAPAARSASNSSGGMAAAC